MPIVDTRVGHRHRIDDPNSSSNYLFFSDSTLVDAMAGVRAGGDSQESRQPAATLAAMRKYLEAHPGAANGKTVVLSSLTNNPQDAASLEAAIDLAKKNGAAKVVVVGMGDSYAAGNAAIKKLAEEHGAVYAELGPNNGIHSRNVPALVNNITSAAGTPAPVVTREPDNHVTLPQIDVRAPVRHQRAARRDVSHLPGHHRQPGAAPNRHALRHPGAMPEPRGHGHDRTLTEALHGRASRAGIRHMLKIEHSLGVHIADGVFGPHTIRNLQHRLHNHETGILNQRDVNKIEGAAPHPRRRPQIAPGAH